MATISIFLGLFNIFAGVMFVAAFLSFIGGFIRYLVLLGTERRKEGLVLMVWGIAVLFVLVVLLGIVNIIQGPLFYLIAIGGGLFLCMLILLALNRAGSGGGASKEH